MNTYTKAKTRAWHIAYARQMQLFSLGFSQLSLGCFSFYHQNEGNGGSEESNSLWTAACAEWQQGSGPGSLAALDSRR